jgi:hypothetical protein
VGAKLTLNMVRLLPANLARIRSKGDGGGMPKRWHRSGAGSLASVQGHDSRPQWHAVRCTKEREEDHGPMTIVTWQLQSAFRASSVRRVRREPVEAVEQQVLRGRDSHCGSGMSSSSPIQGWRYPNSDACKRALVSE